MNFSSIGRSSNFAQAGKSAADETVRAFAASRRNSPKYGELAQKAQAIRTEEKIAVMKAESAVAQAGIKAQTDVKTTQIETDAKSKLKGAKRKAGALAAAGKLFGTAGQYLGEKRTKREVGEYDSYYTEREEKARAKAADLRTEAENVDLTGGFTPMETPTIDIPGSSTDSTSTSSNTGGTGSSSTSQTSGAATQGSDGWAKLSKVIRFGEGTSGQAGYNTQFTGTQFQDMSKHPRQLRSGGGYTSDAAGAYQFLSTTWDGAKNALNLPDFSPESQEKAGRYLTQQRGVNPDQVFTNINDFRAAMDKLAPEWASLPYSGVSPTGHGRGSSYYGQGGKSLDQLWSLYNS